MRKAVFAALKSFENNKGYSNLVINAFLKTAGIEGRDRSLFTNIFYGVIERKLTLEYFVSKNSNMPLEKIDKKTLLVLKIALFQIVYLEKIPNSAAVNTAVEIAKEVSPKAVNFVNAVLRNAIRKGFSLPEDTEIKYSASKDIVDVFTENLGRDETISFLEDSLKPPPVYIRVNTLKTDEDSLMKNFSEIDVNAEKTCLKNCLKADNISKLLNSGAFKNGYFHIQDISSQLAIYFLNPKKGESVIDFCAAPGGKSFTAAEYMENEGSLLSIDIHESKIGLLIETAEKLGIEIMKTEAADSSKVKNPDKADKIICDMPCSGLGVIRRKPEIKYKTVKELEGFPKTQLAILNNAAGFLKEGGELLYSTCTVNKEENEKIIEKFLSENSGYRLEKLRFQGENHDFLKLLPKMIESDGFFIAKLKKM